ncbi:MAG: pro-sigmaK processing inhibitor BofA family protein [Oscillospiraceae bacterium]|jgi:hypothetical protein|nr:pro-sigmaK processing inhibitor BofA family protein [Oscillospiraceae bacterium]
MTLSLWRLTLILGAALALICMLGLLARERKSEPNRAIRIAANAGSGFAVMLAINLLLPSFGLYVPVNLLSIAAVGVLGAPGAALAAALYMIL